MLSASGNLFKCHEEVLYLQPLVPPKRFDIFPPITGECSEGLGALRFFFKQYNGGLLPDIILTQCSFHRGTRLNSMKRFCICSLSLIPPKRFGIFYPLTGVLGFGITLFFVFLFVFAAFDPT